MVGPAPAAFVFNYTRTFVLCQGGIFLPRVSEACSSLENNRSGRLYVYPIIPFSLIHVKGA